MFDLLRFSSGSGDVSFLDSAQQPTSYGVCHGVPRIPGNGTTIGREPAKHKESRPRLTEVGCDRPSFTYPSHARGQWFESIGAHHVNDRNIEGSSHKDDPKCT